MNSKVEYGLEGAFKVDLLKNGQFVSTTDYFPNFITATGLTYPSVYAFADCFRFLSLGVGAAANTGSVSTGSLGTTGLQLPINLFSTTTGFQSANYIDWRGYVTGGDVSSCGTALSETGPRFYRAWFVPTGFDEITVNEPAAAGLNISEFMVSPSSGTDPTGKYAFSRVLRNLTIPNGYRAIITYQLKVNIANTGLSILSGGSFRTGDAETTNDLALLQTWTNLSGYYRQVYHGLRCIDSLGMTYIPRLGDAMEPSSRNTSKMAWYLSPDNSQFEVNGISGGPQVSLLNVYKNEGLMDYISSLNFKSVIAYPTFSSFLNDLTSFYINNNPSVIAATPPETTPSNIRLGAASSAKALSLPQVGNYRVIDSNLGTFNYQSAADVSSKTISYATPGVKGFSSSYADYGKSAVFSSFTTNLPIQKTGQNLLSGRKKTITRKSVFAPISSLGYNTRFGSLIYAYNASASTDTIGNKTYYPMIDCLFFDSSGRSLMPHYRFITGFQFTERGTGLIGCIFSMTGGIIPQNVSGNILRFTQKSGIFGPYATPLTHQALTSGFGFTGQGDIKPDASGSLTAIGGLGWGAMYGIKTDSAFAVTTWDIGLNEHTINNLNDPSVSGSIFWPEIISGNEVKTFFTGLQYFNPDISPTGIIIDNSGWFGPTKQIIRKTDFELLDGNYNVLSSGGFVKFTTGTPLASLPAYVITKKQYSGGSIASTDDIVNNTNYNFTGYAIPSSIIGGKLFGTVWKDQGQVPINNLTFNPTINSRNIVGLQLNTQRVEDLFGSGQITGRGYPNGTGGTPFTADSSVNIFFTGFSGTTPLYLTYVNTSPTSGAYSLLSGVVFLTNFCAPTGFPLHTESVSTVSGARLAPSYFQTNHFGLDSGNAVRGGEYPALSFDNGLEVYLDISWSSPCGNSVAGGTCFEPI